MQSRQREALTRPRELVRVAETALVQVPHLVGRLHQCAERIDVPALSIVDQHGRLGSRGERGTAADHQPDPRRRPGAQGLHRQCAQSFALALCGPDELLEIIPLAHLRPWRNDVPGMRSNGRAVQPQRVLVGGRQFLDRASEFGQPARSRSTQQRFDGQPAIRARVLLGRSTGPYAQPAVVDPGRERSSRGGSPYRFQRHVRALPGLPVQGRDPDQVVVGEDSSPRIAAILGPGRIEQLRPHGRQVELGATPYRDQFSSRCREQRTDLVVGELVGQMYDVVVRAGVDVDPDLPAASQCDGIDPDQDPATGFVGRGEVLAAAVRVAVVLRIGQRAGEPEPVHHLRPQRLGSCPDPCRVRRPALVPVQPTRPPPTVIPRAAYASAGSEPPAT